ncbi:hypothetical protein Bbelb_101640 [Branchiostoma belcheri]|nr:hypothetical protein Bbelb_101640 [Branchiostoma belcheri]
MIHLHPARAINATTAATPLCQKIELLVTTEWPESRYGRYWTLVDVEKRKPSPRPDHLGASVRHTPSSCDLSATVTDASSTRAGSMCAFSPSDSVRQVSGAEAELGIDGPDALTSTRLQGWLERVEISQIDR